jgi:hypothetical protein
LFAKVERAFMVNVGQGSPTSFALLGREGEKHDFSN